MVDYASLGSSFGLSWYVGLGWITAAMVTIIMVAIIIVLLFLSFSILQAILGGVPFLHRMFPDVAKVKFGKKKENLKVDQKIESDLGRTVQREEREDISMEGIVRHEANVENLRARELFNEHEALMELSRRVSALRHFVTDDYTPKVEKYRELRYKLAPLDINIQNMRNHIEQQRKNIDAMFNDLLRRFDQIMHFMEGDRQAYLNLARDDENHRNKAVDLLKKAKHTIYDVHVLAKQRDLKTNNLDKAFDQFKSLSAKLLSLLNLLNRGDVEEFKLIQEDLGKLTEETNKLKRAEEFVREASKDFTKIAILDSASDSLDGVEKSVSERQKNHGKIWSLLKEMYTYEQNIKEIHKFQQQLQQTSSKVVNLETKAETRIEHGEDDFMTRRAA